MIIIIIIEGLSLLQEVHDDEYYYGILDFPSPHTEPYEVMKMRFVHVIFFLIVTDVTSLYQTLRFIGLDQTMNHLCKTNR